MYIELEPEQRVIPKITFKRSHNSNVIKKSEVRCFQEAQALVMAMQERADECQSILEQQVIQMIEDKEKALNEYVEESYNNGLKTGSNGKMTGLIMLNPNLVICLMRSRKNSLMNSKKN